MHTNLATSQKSTRQTRIPVQAVTHSIESGSVQYGPQTKIDDGFDHFIAHVVIGFIVILLIVASLR